MQAIGIRIAIMTAVAVVAAVFLVATGAFLCVALFEGLKVAVEQAWLAALVTAAVLLVAAGLVMSTGTAIARAAEAKARRDALKKGPATARIGLEIGRILGEGASGYIGKNPVRVLVGAVVLGFAFGAIPKLREFLMDFLKSK